MAIIDQQNPDGLEDEKATSAADPNGKTESSGMQR
jgi:hypothetical protein